MIPLSKSMSDVMPTFKRIVTTQKEFTYSRGNTYKENGLILKHQLTNLKINQLVSTFARKLKRNITTSPPISFELENLNEENDKRWIKWKGWQIKDSISPFILFFDIIMSIVVFSLSTFQGFLEDFRRADSISTAVITLKAISLIVFVVRLIMAMVTVDYVDDTLYIYVVDIIKKELMGGDIFLHIFSMVMVVTSIVVPSDETVGVVFFFSSLFKLILIRSNLKILEIEFVSSIKRFYIWNLAKVFIFDIIFGHVIATAFLAISKIHPDNNWIIVKLIHNGFVDQSQTWYIVYIWAYYWACITMLTIGFGDISPVDYREAIVISFIAIISSIVLAYNISEVGSIISLMRKSSQALDRKLGVLRRMMKKSRVPEELEWRIESYLTHEIEIRDQFQYDEHKSIIQNLPEQLKQEYFMESNSEMYQSMSVFQHFQKNTLAKFNRAFVGKVYYPGEYIIRSRVGTDKLIIMKTGEFGLVYWKPMSQMNGTIVQSVNLEQRKSQGLLINTDIFLRGTSLNYDIMALKYSYSLQLDLETFFLLLKESNIDYYYYKSILDKHEKEENAYDYEKCQYCTNLYHTKFECAKLHYMPRKSLVTLKSLARNIPSVRKSDFNRRKGRKTGIHPYYFRKKPFKILQNSLNISSQQLLDEELELDSPKDFAMYFKDFNPENYKGIVICKSRMAQMFFKQLIVHIKGKPVSSLSIERMID